MLATLLLLSLVYLLAPVAPQQQSRRSAEAVYKNIQALKGRPASDVEPLMKAMNRALGVECTHCHVQDQWELETKEPFAVARGMLRMVDYLNANQLSEVESIACWTCHAGDRRPSRLPPERVAAAEALWPTSLPGSDNRKLTMAVYAASLGVGCDHCHVAGDWKSGAKPTHRVVSKMNAMFAEFPKFMPKTARTQCFMCHKGATTPKRAPDGPRLNDR